jgi:uncharacterized membrane protein YoaK (UPF0700 family)
MNLQRYAGIQGMSLGFVAGYVDTLGFVSLFGLFTAHVTGNFILIGAALADPSENAVLLKFLTFPAFIVGVALARILIALVEKRGAMPLKSALSLELALLVGFMACGVAAAPVGTHAGPLAMLAGLLGAVGMGVHSATSRLLLGHLPPTSMMTGNVTQIVIDAVDLARGARQPGLDGRFAKFAMPLLAFAVGCVTAAFGFRWVGFAALAVPVLILSGLLAGEVPAASRG